MRLRLHPNAYWPGIIDRLLGQATDADHKAARETMWVEVEQYVVHAARLPIGPLNEDEDARRDVAVSVLRKLEQGQFRHLREWRQRQRRGTDHASWWGWIQLMAWSLGIDLARGSRQNVARRGEQFRWARVVSVDPQVLADTLGDTLGKSLDFLGNSDPATLERYLTELQDTLTIDAGADTATSELPRQLETPATQTAPSKRR
jgi:hypothetical protein